MPIRPLNKGQNRGKFNQLKSLLQSSDRVQTSDDIANLRAAKSPLLVDPSRKINEQQYGATSFNQSFAHNAQLAAVLYGNEEMEGTSFIKNSMEVKTVVTANK